MDTGQNKLEIRRCLVDELPMVAAFYAVAGVTGRFPPSTESPFGTYLAIQSENIIGAVQLFPFGRRLEMSELLVASDGRRQGVGTQLVQYVCRQAADAGYKSIESVVLTSNGPARALYRRLGFQQARAIVTPEGDALLLEKPLR